MRSPARVPRTPSVEPIAGAVVRPRARASGWIVRGQFPKTSPSRSKPGRGATFAVTPGGGAARGRIELAGTTIAQEVRMVRSRFPMPRAELGAEVQTDGTWGFVAQTLRDSPAGVRWVVAGHDEAHAPRPTARRTRYNAALARRGSPLIWIDPEMRWPAEPTGGRGRQPTFADAAIQACLTLKTLFGLPLRRTTGMVASLPELAGLDWPVSTGRCRTSARFAVGRRA